jgi:N-acetyltransferase 10
MKIKIDSRITTLVENSVKLNHRSLFFIVGDRGKDRVADFYLLLSKVNLRTKASVLWCYKDDLGFSSHKKKRMKQIKKLQQRGNWDTEIDDPFDLFISSANLKFCYYKESHKILGNTYGMCILQDFEALTPNLLCRTIESVEGGGIILILLKTLTNLKQLYTIAMDVHNRYRTPSYNVIEPRFNERFLLSLTTCKNCLMIDDEFNILKLSNHNIEPVENVGKDLELSGLQESLADSFPVGLLLKICKSTDQCNVVMQVLASIIDKTICTYAITAARGRGKSASLGLAIAGAVSQGYSNILVTAPSPENLRAFFEFLVIGLKALGYQQHTHFQVTKGGKEVGKSITNVSVFKTHKQVIQYITVNKINLQCDLLVIDEAAAIPLPFVRRMLGSYPVLLSSTVHGYEGTGRALSLKLLNNLEDRNLKQVKLTIPIRYGNLDPIEKWLSDLLCLEATIPYTIVSSPAHPSVCSLYLVNRDTLFSFHRASELFLHRLMSLFVSSHYRNTPNDLQMLSDAPSHMLFVLLGPIDSESNSLPDVLCALQVGLEGKINQQRAKSQLAKGFGGTGDLIPWTVAEYFQDAAFPELTGARVIRIATHPDLQSMGYGQKALQELEKFFSKELFIEEKPEKAELKEENDEIKPKDNVKPLLQKLSEVRPVDIDYLGVAYGLNPQLYKFWNKSGFNLVFIKQKTSDITGEYSAIMIKSISSTDFKPLFEDFRKRFLNLLSFEFTSLPTSLALNILSPEEGENCNAHILERYVTLYDLKRLEAFCKKLIDFHLILDLLPGIAQLYFSKNLSLKFSNLQKSLLIAIALQKKPFDSLPKEFDFPISQIILLFNKLVKIITQTIKGIFESEIELTLPHKQANESVEEPEKHMRTN